MINLRTRDVEVLRVAAEKMKLAMLFDTPAVDMRLTPEEAAATWLAIQRTLDLHEDAARALHRPLSLGSRDRGLSAIEAHDAQLLAMHRGASGSAVGIWDTVLGWGAFVSAIALSLGVLWLIGMAAAALVRAVLL